MSRENEVTAIASIDRTGINSVTVENLVTRFVLVNESDEAAKITNGGLDINIQDQNTPIVDLHFTTPVRDLTIDTDTVPDNYTISVTAAGTPVAGSMIEIYEDTRFLQAHILSVAGTGPFTLTIDEPIDSIYTTAATAKETSDDMAVDGSSTPVKFAISPQYVQNGEQWDITRFTLSMTHGSAGDDGKFGGIAELNRGICVRKENGITRNIFVAKNGSELALHTGGDLSYVTRSGGGGSYGTRTRRTFAGQAENGVTVRVGSTDNEKLVIIIQDDLTGLDSFKAVGQGHIVE